MSKQIIIIGGGISGLALLHFLKKRYFGYESIDIRLLEKNGFLGGTIRSIAQDGYLFETGPNGFLDSKQRTLDFVEELGLTGSLVRANQEAQIRYLSIHNKLQKLPGNSREFLSTSLLNFGDKCRVLREIIVPKGGNSDETVYDFGKRRLGEKFAQQFLDPMVSGIYGGDARQANLKAVFPRIYALEEQHGSLFRAMIKIRKEKKIQGKKHDTGEKTMGAPGGTLTSFQKGVGELIETIGRRYAAHIQLNQAVQSVVRRRGQYVVSVARGEQYTADELYMCAPAYGAAAMINQVSRPLADLLRSIQYAPIAVVGLRCPKSYFAEVPKGYGYLIPSSENKEVLGVLFESNIFPDRSPEHQMLFRVMIGGARHPDILEKSKEDLLKLALDELRYLKGTATSQDGPEALFYMPWPKAIPQYVGAYNTLIDEIDKELAQLPGVHCVANYIKGVSLNDCIEQAYQKAQESKGGQK